MESRIAKVLDSSRRGVPGMKRKRASKYAAYLSRASKMKSPPCTPLSGKRRRLDGCHGKAVSSGYHSKQSLLCYSNFSKTGVPERLMFFENGEWTDFPQDAVNLVRKSFQQKKQAFVVVEFDGNRFVVDFLRSIHVNFKTGEQRPIAWIDEAGSCFFPEIYLEDEQHECCCQPETQKAQVQEIKLQVDIDINGIDQAKVKEYSGESNALVKRIQIGEKPAGGNNVVDLEDSNRKSDVKLEDGFEENPFGETLDFDLLRKTFLMGMSPFGGADILDVYRCTGASTRSRLELFQKQIEITKDCRQDANVRYGWLASSKEALSTLTMHGLGYCRRSTTRSTYGIGVHLAATNNSHASASYCDIDENGVRHMVFCRVIMGNMELLPTGSSQFHPSSEDYDSGVDDLQNPRHYIVWTMNTNTHIYPEYVVSFKVSSNVQGHLVGSGNRSVSGLTSVSQGPQNLRSDLSAANLVNNGHPVSDSGESKGKGLSQNSSTQRVPKSPYMPFPVLFAALSNRIPHKDMKLVNILYERFKSKKITRDELVRKLRQLVGDGVLRSTIKALPCKVPGQCELDSAKQNLEGSGTIGL